MPQKQKIDFGFQEVDYEARQGKVNEVFDAVASKYDLMNDLMSFGLHRIWKKQMIDMMPLTEGSKLLDLAGGSGDISFKFLKEANKSGLNASAVLSDINEEMLAVAKERAVDKNLQDNINIKAFNCEEIPFEDNSFDFCTIAFGIRNVTNRVKAISEAKRILKPGGKFVCLEFSHLNSKNLQKIYDEYSFKLIPIMGEKVLNDRASYEYLVESIRKFPDADAFLGELEKAELENCGYKKLTHGVVALHYGWKI